MHGILRHIGCAAAPGRRQTWRIGSGGVPRRFLWFIRASAAGGLARVWCGTFPGRMALLGGIRRGRHRTGQINLPHDLTGRCLDLDVFRHIECRNGLRGGGIHRVHLRRRGSRHRLLGRDTRSPAAQQVGAGRRKTVDPVAQAGIDIAGLGSRRGNRLGGPGRRGGLPCPSRRPGCSTISGSIRLPRATTPNPADGRRVQAAADPNR